MSDYSIWTTREGVKVRVCYMTTSHVRNTIRWLDREMTKAAIGLMTVRRGYAEAPAGEERQRYLSVYTSRSQALINRGRWCVRWMTYFEAELIARGEESEELLPIALERAQLTYQRRPDEAAL